MGVWEAMELLNTLIDDSDPDVSSAQAVQPFTGWRLIRGCIDDRVADRAPVADCGSHPERWQAGMDAGMLRPRAKCLVPRVLTDVLGRLPD